MKNLKKITCLLMILVLAMSFTACGSKDSSKDSKKNDTKVNASLAELTVAEVLEKVAEASKDSTGAAFEASFEFDIEMAEEAIKASADMTGETLVKDEEVSSHVDMELEMDYAGQSMTMPMEMYQVQDGDVVKMYMNMFETWTYEESDMSDMGISFDMSQYEDMLKDIDVNEVLEYLDVAKVETKDGNYVIDMEITLDTIIDIIKESGLLEGEDMDIDLSILPEAALKVNFAVDGTTFLPAAMTVVIEMDDFEIEGQKLAVNAFSIDMKYTSYDVKEIVVPDEAIESETAESELDDYDEFDDFEDSDDLDFED